MYIKYISRQICSHRDPVVSLNICNVMNISNISQALQQIEVRYFIYPRYYKEPGAQSASGFFMPWRQELAAVSQGCEKKRDERSELRVSGSKAPPTQEPETTAGGRVTPVPATKEKPGSKDPGFFILIFINNDELYCGGYCYLSNFYHCIQF